MLNPVILHYRPLPLSLWLSTEVVAFSPRPHPYLPCFALQTKILWINWSLNAIDTIETWVLGNLTAPTERSQPAIRCAWERWRIVCLAALSVEDIDIYLFGTMITGILLIGLGFALGYRRIQKTGTAVQSPTRLPV